MSAQQDIYATGSESRPPMLNKENYVPWSSRLLRYAKSRTNGKLIHNSILNGPYVRRMIPEPDPLALMANSNNPYAFLAPHQDQSSFNQNYLQQPMPNPEDITDPTTAMNMALALMAKAFKLNYSSPTNNNQRISSNSRNRQIAQPGMNMGQDRQMPRRMDAAYLQTQLLIAQKKEAGIQLQAEEYDLMAAAAYLEEIKEVNANCILMANLQQASTSGTQTDSAPVYDSDRSAEVHENCDDNEIFNMFTQEEQYTELLEPIPESHWL
uniref:Uncharacterized protein n=1 Tax=Tanacetum cinerariifolium TaxID=118510 RepID=A0A6L2P016_TANCI|nr:hypothetical protein [Tanacetum cinerariifolium]